MSEKLLDQPAQPAPKDVVLSPESVVVFDRLAEFIADPDKKPLMAAAAYGDFIPNHYHYFRQVRKKQSGSPSSYQNRFESRLRRSLATTYSQHLLGAVVSHDQACELYGRAQWHSRPLPTHFLQNNATVATAVVCGLDDLVSNGVRIRLLPPTEFDESALALNRYLLQGPLLLTQLLIDNQAKLAHFWMETLSDCTQEFDRLEKSLRQQLRNFQDSRDDSVKGSLPILDDI